MISLLVLEAFAAVPPEEWYGGQLLIPPADARARAWLAGVFAPPPPSEPRAAATWVSPQQPSERTARIWRLYEDGMSVRAIASLMHIGTSRVYRILQGRCRKGDV